MLADIQKQWTTILNAMKDEHEISDVAFKTWLLPLEVVGADDHVVTILVPETSFLNYLRKKYSLLLQVTIEEVTGYECTVEFISPEENKSLQPSPAKKDSSTYTSTQNVNLNPKYTFDTFVVGSNNKMAHAACLAVAESPAEVYNPLFIYGGVGLGKTHLMHSIANFILKNDPSTRVMYVTSEKFTNELIDSIRNKTTTDFRDKYRNNDILLIDDIQFIQGKESTVEEFFHTFNSLHEAKKQIIISSDRSPKDLVNLEDRLVSRFEWGLTVDIQSPDYETRMAILRKKEELDGYNIDNEVIKYIATNIKSNIRELEGALTKVVAMARLNNRGVIDVPLAEEALKDLISPDQAREVTPEIIIGTVAEHFGLKVEDITSTKRNKEVVYPRQIAMYLCRELTATPLTVIGKVMGGRDHTTVMHGIDKVKETLDNDATVRSTVEILKKKINPS
jgi:chromosomal replication initiator protein